MKRRTDKPQIFWRAEGRGPALVLINGYSASGRAWPTAWLRELQRRHRVIRPDNRGSGASRYVRTPFTIEQFADDVIAVMDAEEVGHAAVLGISMGGMIAQELTLRAPSRVETLLLVATRPPVPEYHPMPMAAAWHMLRPPSFRESLYDYFYRRWAGSTAPGFAERHPQVIDELTRQTLERPTARAMLVHQMRAMSGWGHAARLAAIRAPTLVVHGAADPLVPVDNGRTLARLIPNARYEELPGVGHLVAHEVPDQLSALIAEAAVAASAT